MLKKGISFSKKLAKELQNDRATGLAAEQAYYYMLSIFPLLILLLSILPYLQLDPLKAVNFIESVLPNETADTLKENVVNIISERNGGLLTFGILGTLWSASNGMNAFIRAMNQAYDVKETRTFVKARLMSILLTLGIMVAFIVALVLPVFGDVILNSIKHYLYLPDQTEILFRVLRWILAIVIMTAVLTMLYHFAPNKHFPFKQVIPGAVVATILWQLISLAFSFYVSNFGSYSETYGSLGGVIVLMLWFFLTGLTLVLGGEINAIIHKQEATKGKWTESRSYTT